ncbi:hypothetical protein EMPG_13759 [Blastomyces silverae]|uniref:Uncharacterized protein n=1 Tax=Blastomyces silverae TaxID=2060906 RepID=A0A0H1BII6_9EURO|nr:hypothetical protein EMPG_13759 [Blastomyces silverae]
MDENHPQRRPALLPRQHRLQLPAAHQPRRPARRHEHKHLRLREAGQSACVPRPRHRLRLDLV